jgi:hypothetical protein
MARGDWGRGEGGGGEGAGRMLGHPVTPGTRVVQWHTSQMRAARDAAERANASTQAALRSKLSAAVSEEARLRGHSEALEQVACAPPVIQPRHLVPGPLYWLGWLICLIEGPTLVLLLLVISPACSGHGGAAGGVRVVEESAA